MTRNLKAIGLALMAAFALSAVAASAASAQVGQLTAPEPVTLTGTEIAGKVNALTSPLGSVTCPGSTYTGHAVLTHSQTTEGKKHELIKTPVSEVTVTPKYIECRAHIPILGTRPVTVLMTGCDFDIEAGETTGGEHTYAATAQLTCPPNVEPHVEIFKAGSEHTVGNRVCTITFAEQYVTGAHLKHTTLPNDDIDLEGTFTGIKEKHEGTLCGTGEGTASLDINVTIKGHNALGEDIPVTVTDK